MAQSTDKTVTPARPQTEDSGRVRLGGGMISFDDTKVRDEIKDAGRTKLGGGMIRF
jgi:hypothetical protein